jgi:hypothetical protein
MPCVRQGDTAGRSSSLVERSISVTFSHFMPVLAPQEPMRIARTVASSILTLRPYSSNAKMISKAMRIGGRVPTVISRQGRKVVSMRCVQPLQNARIGGYHTFVAVKLVVHSGNTGSAGTNRSR